MEMEHSLFTNKLLFSKIPSVFFDITNVVLGILSILVSAVLFTTSYKKIRCKFPVTVNCWFCNNYTKVPYDLSNSWNCPQCKQYNGFNKDGGYNKIIHEQYDNKLNEDVVNILKKSCNIKENYSLQSNGFCKLCNINQELKVQQLALFVPIDENNYFEEIEQYREKLEKAYRLCSACEKALKETLEKQEYNLLKNRLNDHKLNFSEPLKNPIVYKYSFHTLLGTIKRIRVRGSRWLCIVFSTLLFFASVFQYIIEHQLSHSELLNNVSFEPFQPVMEVISVHLSIIYKFRGEISFFGLLCCVLSHSVRRGKISKINVSLWLLVHILFWSNLTGFQILLCGTAVFLNVLGISNKNIYLSKKSLNQNCSFRPEKRVFSEAYNHSEKNLFSPNKNTLSPPMEKFAFNADTSDLIESKKLQEIKTKASNGGETRSRNKKKEKNKENEIEFALDKNTEETRSKPDNSLNSSIFSKSFLSTLENQDKTKEETMEPLDEVDNNLGCLNLGRKHKKSTKPSNYLFASHNFSGKKSPASPSVIKPAKFIRNSSSSWTGTESNESASRSSTPSSGYSSQKIDKTEPNRYSYFSRSTRRNAEILSVLVRVKEIQSANAEMPVELALAQAEASEPDFNTFENKSGLAEDMKFLASMPELCDVTFLVGDTREPVCAVKAVLAARSRVFHKMLYQAPSPQRKKEPPPKENKLRLFLKRSSEPLLNLQNAAQQPQSNQHHTLIIEEFEPDVFRQLIEYIHTGCVTLQPRTLLGVMNAADYYGLDELRRACAGFVQCCINVDTVCALLASAERYIQYKCTKSLVQKVLEFVDEHGNEVLNLGSFTLLPQHVVRLILARDELRADEFTKFQAALMWGKKYCDSNPNTSLKDVISNFLEYIQFHKIPANVLMREVHPLGLVPYNIIMNALAYQADPASVDPGKLSPNRVRKSGQGRSMSVQSSLDPYGSNTTLSSSGSSELVSSGDQERKHSSN